MSVAVVQRRNGSRTGRTKRRRDGSGMLMVLAGAAALSAAMPVRAEWPQWGGPNRNFVVSIGGVKLDWPAEGPRVLWEAPVGPGSSGVIADDDAAYTMYRDGQHEVVVAFDMKTGFKLWEHKYEAPIPEGYPPPDRLGPRATPVITGVRIFTVGSLGHVRCLNKTTGQLIWSGHPAGELKLVPPKEGYSSSPMIYKDRLIFALGSEGAGQEGGVISYHQRSGSFLWAHHKYEPVTASLVVVPIHGKDHLLAATATKVEAMDPLNGPVRFEWEIPAAGTPAWNTSREVLIVPTASEPGSQAIDFKTEDKAGFRQNWSGSGPKWKSAITTGNVAIGVSGESPSNLSAVGIYTGEQLFRDVSLSPTHLLYTGNSMVILAEDGTVAVANIDPDAMRIASRHKFEKTGDWGAPAFDRHQLYLRDSKRVRVLQMN